MLHHVAPLLQAKMHCLFWIPIHLRRSDFSKILCHFAPQTSLAKRTCMHMSGRRCFKLLLQVQSTTWNRIGNVSWDGNLWYTSVQSQLFLPRGLVIFPCSLSLVIHLISFDGSHWVVTRQIKWIKCMQQCNPTPSATKKTMAKQTLQDCRGMCWLSKNRFPNNAHFTGDPWRKIKNRDLE